MRPRIPVALDDDDRGELARRAADRSARPSDRVRARIVLMAAEGRSITDIAAELGVSRPTAAAWRGRYEQRGLAGLSDGTRSGRPRRIDEESIIRTTLGPVPSCVPVRRWTCRAVAEQLGVGSATVARAWRRFGVAPRSSGGFEFGTDPPLRASEVRLLGLSTGPTGKVAVIEVGSSIGPVGDPPRDGSPIELVRRCAQGAGGELHVVADPMGRVALRGTAGARAWWLTHPQVHLHGVARDTSWDLLVSAWRIVPVTVGEVDCKESIDTCCVLEVLSQK